MSAASPSTWMPTYWGSYAKKTGHFGALLHGAYLMLIKHYWCSGAPLPDDDTQLWRIATCDGIGQWRKVARPMIAPLFDIRDGLWFHHKVEEELTKARAFIEKQRANGGQGGRPPKNPDAKPKKTQPETQTKPTANPNTNPTHNPKITTTPSYEESHDSKNRNGAARARRNGAHAIGDIVSGEKRRKPQDKADADMIRFLMGKMRMELAYAVETVAAARDSGHDDHNRCRELCDKISRENKLGWFGKESP